jgi:hypothetical protein
MGLECKPVNSFTGRSPRRIPLARLRGGLVPKIGGLRPAGIAACITLHSAGRKTLQNCFDFRDARIGNSVTS